MSPFAYTPKPRRCALNEMAIAEEDIERWWLMTMAKGQQRRWGRQFFFVDPFKSKGRSRPVWRRKERVEIRSGKDLEGFYSFLCYVLYFIFRSKLVDLPTNDLSCIWMLMESRDLLLGRFLCILNWERLRRMERGHRQMWRCLEICGGGMSRPSFYKTDILKSS